MIQEIDKINNKNYSKLEIKEIIIYWLDIDYEDLSKEERELECITARKISSLTNGQKPTIWSFVALAFYRWFAEVESRLNFCEVIDKERDLAKKKSLQEGLSGRCFSETEAWNHLQAALDLIKSEF